MQKNLFRIALSGTVASGKTSLGHLLAKQLNIPFFSVGQFLREYANSKSYSIHHLMNQINSNPKYNLLIHRLVSIHILKYDEYVIDYRLGYLLTPKPFSIFLTVSNSVAANRLANEGKLYEINYSVSSPFEYVVKRNDALKCKFLSCFSSNFEDSTNYDLVLDTVILNQNEMVKLVIEKYRKI
jgi:cytidylate kinase